MNRPFINFFRAVIAGLDLLVLNLVIFLSQIFLAEHIPADYVSHYLRFWLFVNTSWLAVCWITAVYDERILMSFELFAKKTTNVYLFWLGTVMIYLFFFHQFELSRIYIIATLVGFCISLMFNRFMYLVLRYFLKSREHLVKKIIILGYNEVAKKLAGYLEEERLNTEIVGFCEDAENMKELSNYPVVSNVNNLLMVSRQMGVNEIYSTIAPEHNRGIYEIMKQADQQCIRFRIIPDLSFVIDQPVHINYLRDMPVLSVRKEPLDDVSSRARKRFFDICFSLFTIVFVLSWLVPLLAILIMLESRGPVFFIQKRSGKDNKPFDCIKFRSMRMNTEANTRQARRNDDRFTRIGEFMRRTNLDEFPQFINVLKGQMSIIGPRPHMLRHTEDYSKILNEYMVRQFLKPGITGWAQVNGFRGEIKDDSQLRQRIEHDIWYMENWSLWLDIKIIFLTVFNTIKGDKNAF